MKPINLMITGMFRSGTTLIARMLNSHPNMAVASDPFRPVFKTFRNSSAHRCFGEDFDSDAPLDDYYFYHRKQELFSEIQSNSFRDNLPDNSLDYIRKEARKMCETFSQNLAPWMEELTGENYREVLLKGHELIDEVYGNKETKVSGFKEVWTGEFAPHYLEAIDNSRVIHVVRDPRAVAASNLSSGEAYPLYFLGRQWRKLAAMALIDSKRYADDVFVVRYEELIRQPEREIKDICEFLSVDFHPNLADPATFTDGSGRPWKQNSHHFEGKQKFNTDSIDKWKDSLADEQVSYLEMMCHFEMNWFDYSLEKAAEDWAKFVFCPPEIAKSALADWLEPYVTLDKDKLMREVGLEYSRAEIVRKKDNLADGILKRLLLIPELKKYISDSEALHYER